MTRILLVDDDAELLGGLERALLRAGGFEVSTCDCAGAAIAKLERGLRPEVALIDLGLPDQPGVSVVRAMRSMAPDGVPLVLTVQEDAPSVFDALRAGARGYLLKSTPLDRLLEAVRDAQAGGAPMTPSIARFLVDSLASTRVSEDDEHRVDALTGRERDVLRQLARGHSYADVASVLGIGTGTVQTHVKSIYAKLEVASKAEAAALAAKLGWV